MSDSDDQTFTWDEVFWTNYVKGRPQPPQSFFDRIYRYHQEHGGQFDVAHDAGAGIGPHSQQLRSKFRHVIVSDMDPETVRSAQRRLGSDGYSFRAAKVEEADDMPPASVDLVFAANVLHFAADQSAAVRAIARQLRPGATFAGAGFGPARFHDARVQDVWSRMTQQGGRVLLQHTDPAEQTIKVIERSQGHYNVAPLDDALFLPGTQRVHLNMAGGGLTGLLPLERRSEATKPSYTGPGDVETFESDEGWGFEFDLHGFREHFASFPYSNDPEAFGELFRELEDLLRDGSRLDGIFPAKLILATRR